MVNLYSSVKVSGVVELVVVVVSAFKYVPEIVDVFKGSFSLFENI